MNKFLRRCGLASPMGDQGQLWLFGPPESLATPFGLNAGLCSFGDHLLRSRQLPGARVCPSSPILSSPSDRVRACSPAVRARLRTELGEIVPNAYHLAAPGRRHIPPGSAPLSTLPKARIAPHSARRAFQKRPTWRRRSSRRSTRLWSRAADPASMVLRDHRRVDPGAQSCSKIARRALLAS